MGWRRLAAAARAMPAPACSPRQCRSVWSSLAATAHSQSSWRRWPARASTCATAGWGRCPHALLTSPSQVAHTACCLPAGPAPLLQVSVHTSNLALAYFLPPGAATFEILPRHWGWLVRGQGRRRCRRLLLTRRQQPMRVLELSLPSATRCSLPALLQRIDEFFRSFSVQLGDVHHYAWRAQGLNETLLPERAGRLMANWTAAQCMETDCVEALTTVRAAAVGRGGGSTLPGRAQRGRTQSAVPPQCMPRPRRWMCEWTWRRCASWLRAGWRSFAAAPAW